MGTRSTIALEFADGTVEQVYCHWDGYLDHNGAILKEHYSDPYKLRELIDLGDCLASAQTLARSTPLASSACQLIKLKHTKSRLKTGALFTNAIAAKTALLASTSQ